VDGLRTRDLSGKNAGRGTYAVDRVEARARLGASRGRAQRYLVPGPEVVRRDRSSGDMSVLSI
jgi:hypothetical protein